MILFIAVSAFAVVHRDFLVSALSALLAIVCCGGIYFTSIFLRHLPNMHRQLTDYEKRERTLHGENDVN